MVSPASSALTRRAARGAGMGNWRGSKSPTVRLQMWRPALAARCARPGQVDRSGRDVMGQPAVALGQDDGALRPDCEITGVARVASPSALGWWAR